MTILPNARACDEFEQKYRRRQRLRAVKSLPRSHAQPLFPGKLFAGGTAIGTASIGGTTLGAISGGGGAISADSGVMGFCHRAVACAKTDGPTWARETPARADASGLRSLLRATASAPP